ncbi:carbon storage regulator [Endozoicomonas sp. ALD040]|uniref:carbon storage regulator n=1 Tax=unclassified Endozoicomonas TaxID=2644528 RepID=UPI003BAF8579
MLILARKNGESIRINNTVRLTLQSHNEQQVKVLLESPKGKAILVRPVGKKLFSEGGVHISTTRSHQGMLRFAFRAPSHITIWREEIWLKMHQEEHKARKNKEVA